MALWNLVGAGLFGFLINPPIALYYMQGLNTTPVHAHTALFGVYGLLSLGLVLVMARQLTGGRGFGFDPKAPDDRRSRSIQRLLDIIRRSPEEDGAGGR